ncbi:hypothetical protein [Roseisolibacter agri]|uniref:Uncharacterized protein n=1 Tax=Roseisolibacter agri TaxID=2014610 RepID=A0AA37V8M9_9BACT|nr:hypothetical protein [Roseisolibacter agri]GLC27956.1 hypothetical protein rosag_44690 [Roseisolibacter agri]
MADQADRTRGDEQEQDGLGRDAAHGGGRDDTTGGSYGRSTGRAGDDLSASSDDASSSGRDAGDAGDASGRRQGLEGRGFDAGTGYGGGGNASAYRAGSSYGGQGGSGGAQIPRGTDEHSDNRSGEQAGQRDRDGRSARGRDDADALDLDAASDVRRRDPSR